MERPLSIDTAAGRPGEPAPPQRGDLTTGPLFKTLVLFSLPVLLGNVLQSLNGSVNTVWIGRLLGEEALAATSSSNIVMFLVFAAIFGISMATTVHVGQYFGARDLDAMRRSFGAGLGLCLMLSAAIAVLGWIGAPALLDLLNLPGSSRHFALDYLRVFLGSDSPAIPVSLHIQNLAIWTYVPFGITIVLFGTLRAYGVVMVQIAILFTSMYGVRLGTYAVLYPRIAQG